MNSSWGPLIPSQPVRDAVAHAGYSLEQVSFKAGYKKDMAARCLTRTQIRLSTAERLLVAVGRVDVLHVELAEWWDMP